MRVLHGRWFPILTVPGLRFLKTQISSSGTLCISHSASIRTAYWAIAFHLPLLYRSVCHADNYSLEFVIFYTLFCFLVCCMFCSHLMAVAVVKQLGPCCTQVETTIFHAAELNFRHLFSQSFFSPKSVNSRTMQIIHWVAAELSTGKKIPS